MIANRVSSAATRTTMEPHLAATAAAGGKPEPPQSPSTGTAAHLSRERSELRHRLDEDQRVVVRVLARRRG